MPRAFAMALIAPFRAIGHDQESQSWMLLTISWRTISPSLVAAVDSVKLFHRWFGRRSSLATQIPLMRPDSVDQPTLACSTATPFLYLEAPLTPVIRMPPTG